MVTGGEPAVMMSHARMLQLAATVGFILRQQPYCQKGKKIHCKKINKNIYIIIIMIQSFSAEIIIISANFSRPNSPYC